LEYLPENLHLPRVDCFRALPGHDPYLVPDSHPARPFPLTDIIADYPFTVDYRRLITGLFYLVRRFFIFSFHLFSCLHGRFEGS
jgi:hypothetical protein